MAQSIYTCHPSTPPTHRPNPNNPNTLKYHSCDGAEANRTYFRDIAMGVPRDSVVLTLGCGAYVRVWFFGSLCVFGGVVYPAHAHVCAYINHHHHDRRRSHPHNQTKKLNLRQVPLQQEDLRDDRRRPAPPHGTFPCPCPYMCVCVSMLCIGTKPNAHPHTHIYLTKSGHGTGGWRVLGLVPMHTHTHIHVLSTPRGKQCNDAFSAIKVAAALAEHYRVGLNDLPINYAISWFEQKGAFRMYIIYI